VPHRHRSRHRQLRDSRLNVSADSIDRNKPPADPNNTNKPNTDSASEPQGHELVYAAHVSLDRTAMAIDGNDVPLSPGMAVTVEIKTGAQRVITYPMSPLLRFEQEALHER
jgi:hemolysin D